MNTRIHVSRWMLCTIVGVVCLLQRGWAEPKSPTGTTTLSRLNVTPRSNRSVAPARPQRKRGKGRKRSVRAVLYADTGILDLRANGALTDWSVGLWRSEQLIEHYQCKRARCTITLPQLELKALVQRWDQETEGEQDTTKNELMLPWKTRPDLAQPPLRSTPNGVWLGWSNVVDTEPTHPIIIDKIRVNRSMITSDELIATREPVKVRLAYPELVKSVSCVGAECVLATRSMRFFAIDRRRAQVRVKFQLKDGVKSLKDGRWVKTQQRQLNVQRCVIVTPNLPLLAGVREHRAVIAMARGCGAGEERYLRAESNPETRIYLNELLAGVNSEWRFFELSIEQIPNNKRSIKISILKRRTQSVLLGAVRIPITHLGIPQQLRLKMNPLGKIDFIPTNHSALLQVAFDPLAANEIDGPNSIIPKTLAGYYQLQSLPARPKRSSTLSSYLIKASPQATGSVPIMFSYRPKYQAPFIPLNNINFELATFPSAVRLPLRPVNTPVALTTDQGDDGVVVLRCVDREGRRQTIKKGLVKLIPFQSRHSCQVTIHRNRIPKSSGTQHIQVSVKRDSFNRNTPQYKRMVTVKHSPTPLSISIPIRKATEFERVEITIGHAYGSARYDFSPQQDLGAEARYELVLGDQKWSVSLSTSMPTGLFRYGLTPEDRSAVSLSAGGLTRLLWLYSEGRPFPLGLEFGALVTGIDDDPHLSLVGGIGLSVPVLNANTPFEASFNLHAWFEYAPTRVDDGSKPWSFLFGPSFAVGKFSTQF